MPRNNRVSASLLVFGLLLLVAAIRAPLPASFGQEAGSPGSAWFAVTAPGQGQGSNTLFMVNAQTGRLLVYEHRFGGALRLTAVRNMQYESQFEEWPNPDKKGSAQEPSVRQIFKELKG